VPALIWAALTGHHNVIKVLLDRGANVKAKAEDSMTALKIAQKMGFKEIQTLLKARGERLPLGNEGVA